jgi:hypothetical protein
MLNTDPARVRQTRRPIERNAYGNLAVDPDHRDRGLGCPWLLWSRQVQPVDAARDHHPPRPRDVAAVPAGARRARGQGRSGLARNCRSFRQQCLRLGQRRAVAHGLEEVARLAERPSCVRRPSATRQRPWPNSAYARSGTFPNRRQRRAASAYRLAASTGSPACSASCGRAVHSAWSLSGYRASTPSVSRHFRPDGADELQQVLRGSRAGIVGPRQTWVATG